MKKKVFFSLFLILVLIANISLASYSTVQMEVVEEPICTIEFSENSGFEKRLISKDLNNKEVTLQLQVTNKETMLKPTGELVLVLDNSDSMNNFIDEEETATRKDLIFESAKTLISNLLEGNDSLQIGIVTFSSYYNPDNIGDTSQEGVLTADASIVSEFSNNISDLNNSIDNIQATGARTDLDAGITLGSEQFTEENNNKYMIVLTDGVPNIALGNNSYYSDEVINLTKTKLQEIGNQGINITTMLTGIDTASDPTPTNPDKTYGQIIEEIFGTEETPTVGDFYYVTDNEVEQTITQDIYNSLLPVSQSYTDIDGQYQSLKVVKQQLYNIN